MGNWREKYFRGRVFRKTAVFRAAGNVTLT